MPEFRTREGVEIARVGKYKLSSGEFDFTREHLAAAVRNAQSGPAARLKAGHVDPRFDGEPSVGTVRNLRLVEDGDAIVGDYADVPAGLDDWLDSAYPGRSIEATATLDPPDMRITHVALLGVTLPGIDTLADLPGRFEQPFAIAAAQDGEGRHLTFVLASTEEAAAKVGQLVDDGADSRPSTPSTEVSTMDPKELREKLGLAEDASAEDVTTALDSLNARPDPETVVPVTEVDDKVELAVAAARKEERDKIAASGGKVVDDATLEQLKDDAAAGRAAREQQITASRESFIDSAIKAGKFPPARREHFVSLMTKDDEGTREYIEKLETGVIPVDGELGIAASGDDMPATSTGWFPQLASKES